MYLYGEQEMTMIAKKKPHYYANLMCLNGEQAMTAKKRQPPRLLPHPSSRCHLLLAAAGAAGAVVVRPPCLIPARHLGQRQNYHPRHRNGRHSSQCCHRRYLQCQHPPRTARPEQWRALGVEQQPRWWLHLEGSQRWHRRDSATSAARSHEQ